MRPTIYLAAAAMVISTASLRAFASVTRELRVDARAPRLWPLQDAQRQDPQQKGPQRQDQTQQRPPKLSAWPKLSKRDGDRARAAAKQFRKQQAQLHSAASARLKQMGAGVAPILIPLISDRAQNINEHIFEVLDHVVDTTHAALVARETRRKSAACRRYVARRLAGMRDKEMLPVLKRMLADKDEDVAFFAALGALAVGEDIGVDGVLAAARQRWGEQRALIAATLAQARSDRTGMLVWSRIEGARPTDQMAGLRLLRYLATKEQRGRLRRYLESADFAVKREAINTARVLHGEAALEKISSFQAINLAKQWLEKL